MAKIRVDFCKKCGCNTEHIYVGKQVANGNYVALTIFSFGLSLLADPLPKYWKCIKCGNIEKKK